jgi:toxin ParE1/3/4
MPPSSVTFHPLAAQEFRRARNSFAQRSRQATLRFVQAVDTALKQVANDPERWPLYDASHRWVKTKKFPYLLIFRSTGEGQVTVVAVAHTSRRPGYWRRRMV